MCCCCCSQRAAMWSVTAELSILAASRGLVGLDAAAAAAAVEVLLALLDLSLAADGLLLVCWAGSAAGSVVLLMRFAWLLCLSSRACRSTFGSKIKAPCCSCSCATCCILQDSAGAAVLVVQACKLHACRSMGCCRGFVAAPWLMETPSRLFVLLQRPAWCSAAVSICLV